MQSNFLSRVLMGKWAIIIFGAFAILGIAQTSTRESGAAGAGDTVKITPWSVSGPVFDGGSHPALLFDHSIFTGYSPAAAAEVIVDLGAAREISQVKVYGPAPSVLTVKADRGGQWETVAGLARLDLSNLAEQWVSFEPESVVTARRLQLVLAAGKETNATGLRELEIWGKGTRVTTATPHDYLQRVLGEVPPDNGRLFAAAPEQAVLGVDGRKARFQVSMDVEPSRIKRAWLVYELTGAGHWIGIRRAVNGREAMGPLHPLAGSAWSSQMERLSPEILQPGANHVDFLYQEEGAPYSLRNVGLLIELEDGSNFVETVEAAPASSTNKATAVRDGNAGTGWSPYPSGSNRSQERFLSLLFDKPTQLDGIWLDMVNSLKGQIDVELLIEDEWSKTGGSIAGPSLRAGANFLEVKAGLQADGVRLIFRHGEESAAYITGVAPVGSGVSWTHGKNVVVAFPTAGEYFGDTAFIRGYLSLPDNGSGEPEVRVAGREIEVDAGVFETAVTRAEAGFNGSPQAPWSVTIEALYPDGETLVRTVELYQYRDKNASLFLPPDNPGTRLAVNPYYLEHDQGVLDLDPDAMDEAPATLTITSLEELDLPPLDPGMTNVTMGPRKGYRFGPPGKKFKKKIRLSLPYDPAKLPDGMTEADIRTYYFDVNTGTWRPLERVEVDKNRRRILSHTDHFTDMINATLVTPDHPEAASFNPTQIKDIKAADPGAGVNLIEPPQATNRGDANLSYPVEIPPGRNGMQPQLAIQYNSGGGNGWLGLGWDLAVPSITIDTRWGVPRYDGVKESETYLLNGSQLTPVAHRGSWAELPARSEVVNNQKQFYPRVEGEFSRIIRHGNGPKNYRWEVTDKNGTRHFYGGTESSVTPGAVLTDDVDNNAGNIFRWALVKSEDTNGNTVEYLYERRKNDSGVGKGTTGVMGHQLYLSSIEYTGHTTLTDRPPYKIEFKRDSHRDGYIRDYATSGHNPAVDRRRDVQIDARGGFKQVIAERLREIIVKYNGEPVRSYQLVYEEGPFGKSLLKDVSQHGTDGAEFNRHTFTYFNDIPVKAGNYSIFAEFEPVHTEQDNLYLKTTGKLGGKEFRQTMLGGTTGSNQGFNGFFGVGVMKNGTNIAGKVDFSANSSKSEGKVALIDIDGDGKPDKVFLKEGPVQYRKNITQAGVEEMAFSEEVLTASGLFRMSRSSSDSSTIGFRGYAKGATGYLQRISTSSTDKSYFADVNGDGIIDHVDNGRVKFGYIADPADPVVRFSKDSIETPNPITGSTFSPAALDGFGEEEKELRKQNPLLDAVRRWQAPYDGFVRIEGTVQLYDFLSDPLVDPDSGDEEKARKAREEYETADGVIVAIQKNGAEYWRARLQADDHNEYRYDQLPNLTAPPRSLNHIEVKQGDRIYFRVSSVDDGSYDRVNWAPRIVYLTGAGQAKEFFDVNNLNEYVYDTTTDTIFAGMPVDIVAPYDGTIHFVGRYLKAVTTDDITFEIEIYEYDEATESYSEEPRTGEPGGFSQTLRWDEEGEGDLITDLEVKTDDRIKINLKIDSPIDLQALQWVELPEMYYTSAWQPGMTLRGPPEPDKPLDPEEQEVSEDDDLPEEYHHKKMDFSDQDVIGQEPRTEIPVQDEEENEYLIKLPVRYNADIYSASNLNTGAPQEPWVAEHDGVLLVTPWLGVSNKYVMCDSKFIDNFYWWRLICEHVPPPPDGDVAFTVKRRGELIHKEIIQVRGEQVVPSTNGYEALTLVQVKAGDELFFDFTTRIAGLLPYFNLAQVRFEYGSRTPWTVPLSDTVIISATGSAWDGRSVGDDEQPGEPSTAVVLIRRDDVILGDRKIQVPHGGSRGINENFELALAEGDAIYVDFFTAEEHLRISKSAAWAHYAGPPQWTATQSGTISMEPVLTYKPDTEPDGDLTMEVFRNNSKVGQCEYEVRNGALIRKDHALLLEVDKGDRLRFELRTRSHLLSSTLADKGQVAVAYGETAGILVPAAALHILMPRAEQVLPIQESVLHFPEWNPLYGNPYRGWAQTSYVGKPVDCNPPDENKECTRADEPLKESLLKLSDKEEDYKKLNVNVYPALPLFSEGRWESVDGAWGVGADNISSTRRGLKYIDIPRPEQFVRDPDIVEPTAGVIRVPRRSSSTGYSTGGGYRLTLARTNTTTRGRLDLLDLNGDRYPDVVSGAGVQFTWPDGSMATGHGGDAKRTTKSRDTSLSFGGGTEPPTNASARTEKANTKPTTAQKVSVSGSFGEGDSDGIIDYIDMNGDGLPDKVRINGSEIRVGLNTGYGFKDEETWGGGYTNYVDTRTVGFSGGWSHPGGIYSGGINLNLGLNDVKKKLMDMNGDGLPDYVEVSPQGVKVAVNHGGGFGDLELWGQPFKTITTTDIGGMGDYGRAVPIGDSHYSLSDGLSTSVTASLNLAGTVTLTYIDLVFGGGANYGETVSQPTVAFMDINGNGLLDSVRSTKDHELKVKLNRIGRTNLLRQVERPLGSSFEIEYQRTGNTYKQPQSAWVMSRVEVHDGHAGDGVDKVVTAYEYEEGYYDRREREFYGYRTVVEKQLLDPDNNTVYRSVTREFLNDSYYKKGLLERELTAGVGGKYLETFQTYRLRDVATGEQLVNEKSTTARVFPELSRTERRFYEGGAGEKSTYVTYTYDDYGNVSEFFDAGEPGDSSDDVHAGITYTGTDGACIAKHIVGLPVEITVRPSRSSDQILRQRKGKYDCVNGTGNLESIQRKVDGDWAETKLDYDKYGNLEQITGPKDANGKEHVLAFTYDKKVDTYPVRIEDKSLEYFSTAGYDFGFGVNTETVDLNGNRITQSYDKFGRLEEVRGPYEQAANAPATISFEYHPEASIPYAVTRHYDRDAEGNTRDTIDTILFIDGLKRVLQTKKDITLHVDGSTTGNEAMSVSGRVEFDHVGRTVKEHFPLSEPKGDNTGFTDTFAEYYTTTEYDVLDRPLLITMPGNRITRHSYAISDNRFRTGITDPEGNRREIHRDVRELITAIKEFNPKGGQNELVTRYSYNPLKEIVGVLDGDNNLTEVEYDTLGRRTGIKNPDTGLVEMRYDHADKLIARITPKLREEGKEITYRYHFSQLIGIDYPDGRNNVKYDYGTDTQENRRAGRVGRIIRVDHESGYDERWYGKLGETVRETRFVHLPQSEWHSGSKHNQGTTQPEEYEVFTTDYQFDTFGRLMKLTFPDNEVLTYRYNSGGQPVSVRGIYKDAPYDYVKYIGYDEFEQRVRVELGNGAVSEYSYQPDTRLLSSLTSQSQGYKFQNLGYTYDKVGNVTKLINDVALPGEGMGGYVSQQFGYDNLYRLTSASGLYKRQPDVREEYTLDMTYDAIHNITRKNQVHKVVGPDWYGNKNATSYDWYYAYDKGRPHAPIHIGERTFEYDLNGNQRGWTHDRNATWRKITWDDENRIQVIEDKGQTSTYGYNDQGQRIIKQSRQNLTVYVNQFFTERNGSIGSKHVFVGNTRMLTKVTGGTNFIRSYDGYYGSKTPPGQVKSGGGGKTPQKEPKGKGKDKDKTDQGKHLGQEKNADKDNSGKSQGKGQEKETGSFQKKDGVHPGQGIFNRSERANEVAQNVCKNKHLAGIYCNDDGELIVDPGEVDPGDGSSDEGWTEGDWFNEGYDYSFLPEREIIKISMGEQLFYYHSDHLGSTGYVTRENGVIHEHIQYFPFGETWVQQGGNTEKSPYLFTSKELDEETGLYYFGARYYDPRTSVWVSVDPILGKYLPTGNKEQDQNLPGMGGVFNPLNLGMYSYTQNNPVKFVDPDGNNAGPVYISGPISSTDLQSGNPVIDNTVLGAVNTAINTTNSIVNLGLNALGVIGDAVAPYEGHIITASTATPMTRLAGTLTASLARLGSLTKSSNINAGFISNLSRAAGALDRGGLTAAGRNLQKHGGREGSAFPAARGNAASINQQAQHIVDDILSNPGSTARTRHHARYGDVTEIVAPDGRGIRYDNNNKFMGFLEP